MGNTVGEAEEHLMQGCSFLSNLALGHPGVPFIICSYMMDGVSGWQGPAGGMQHNGCGRNWQDCS